MSRATVPAPFRLEAGRLWLEDQPLDELAAALQGRAAWLVGHAALSRALARARRAAGGVLAVPVAALGPREALALCAEAGDWALAGSRHELDLARSAGFPAGRVAVVAGVPEDGLLVDALTGGVGALQADARSVARIANGLDLAIPPAARVPPTLPPGALRRVGGLLAPLLAGPPALAVDAAWVPAGRGRVSVLPLRPGGAPPAGAATLRGLPEARPAAASLSASAGRGEWVVVPDPRAAGVHPPDPAHPSPPVVMVRGAAWRPLDARQWPGDGAAGG